MGVTKARLNLAIDEDLKNEVGTILKEMELDYTTAINLYFNKIRQEYRIPFDIEVRRNLTVNDFLGANWREQVEDLGDEWE